METVAISDPVPTSSPVDTTGGGFGIPNSPPNMNFTGHPNFNPNRFRNKMGDTTQAPILLGLGGTLMFISMLLLLARLWTRLRPQYRLKLDDWTVFSAAVLALVQYFLLTVSVIYGLGRHARFVSFGHLRISLRLLFISQIFWYWSITCVKLSVASLLLRVKSTKPWRIFLYTIMGLTVAACIVQTCFQFLQCRPFSVYWDPRVFRTGKVKCFKRSVINGNIVAFSAIQVALDIIFSFIPMTFIRKLNRPRREKIFMCILLALGLTASCAAIVRTMLLQGSYTSPDLFRTNVSIALWAVLEQQFALIAANIPTLKAFMEATLIRIGLFFYDEGSEEQMRGRLVQFGLLGEDEKLDKEEYYAGGSRRPSKQTGNTGSASGGSPRKIRDEFGNTVLGKGSEDADMEMSFEEMIKRSAKTKEFV